MRGFDYRIAKGSVKKAKAEANEDLVLVYRVWYTGLQIADYRLQIADYRLQDKKG